MAAAWSYQQVVEVKVGAEVASTLHGAIQFHLAYLDGQGYNKYIDLLTVLKLF